MLRRILSAVGIFVAGFVIVVGVVLLRFQEVTRAIRHESYVTVPFYRGTTKVNEFAQHLERLVHVSFLTRSEAELADIRERSTHASRELSTAVEELSRNYGAALGDRKVATKAAAVRDSETNQTVTVGQLLTILQADTQSLTDAGVRAIELAVSQASTTKSLEKARDELSKAYRQSFPLWPANEKACGLLSRSVLCVMSSRSTRDLNFVGRARFIEAEAALKKSGMSAETSTAFEAVKESFHRTLELALAVSAATADAEFFNLKARDMERDVDLLRETADQDLDEGQAILVKQSASTSALTVILAVATIVIGGAASYWIAKRLKEIVGRVREADTLVASIASASTEQRDGLSQLNSAVSEMSRITQQNAAGADTSSQIACNLSSQAADLQQVVQELETLVGVQNSEIEPCVPAAETTRGASPTIPAPRDAQESLTRPQAESWKGRL